MKSYKILLIAKKNDIFSFKFFKYLKKNFKYASVIYNDLTNHVNISQKIKNWKGNYIICFRSHYILKKREIQKATHYVINFHPGPPEYRGIGCINFALMKDEKRYGSTVHVINSEKIDSGSIIDVKRWKIGKHLSIDQILNKTYFYQLKQLKKITKFIKLHKIQILIEKNSRFKWSKILNTKKKLNHLYEVKKNVKKKTFKKILRSTVTKKFKPYIILHGKKFILDE